MDTNLEKVTQNIAFAKAFMTDWHKNIDRWRNLYDSKHYSGTPKPGEDRFADPTFTNHVDLAVGILLTNPLVWKATAWKPGTETQKLESQVEKFLVGVMETNINRNEYDTLYEVLLHYVRDGGCVLYTVWDEDAEKKTETVINEYGEEVPVQVYDECPLVQKVIDPSTVYFLPGGKKRWIAVAREEKTSAFDVLMRFGKLPESLNYLKSTEDLVSRTGKLVDYWDATEKDKKGNIIIRNAVLFDNEFVPDRELTVMPKYKSLPYTLGLYKPTDRTDSGKWHSIITPLEEPVKHLEQNINRRQRQINLYSSLPVVSKTANGRAVSMDAVMGQIVTLSQDEDIAFPQWPGNAPDVERQIDFQRSRVQQSGFSDVFIGSGSSQASGYSLSQLGDQNRIRLEQPIAHLKRFWEWAGTKAIEVAVDHAEDNCYLRMYGKIKGKPFTELIPIKDLEGFHVSCEITPNFPNDQVRKHAMGNQVRGVLSEETIMERYLDIQQPDEEYDRKVIEMTQTHPIALQYSMMKVLEAQAKNNDPIAAMELQQLQQQGMQGQPGAPTQPQGMEQPAGGMPAVNRKPEAEAGSTETAPDMTGMI